jgi:regulator of chromosome condensation
VPGFSVNSVIQKTPVLVHGLKNIVDLACGADHALALDNKGKVWAWGSGEQNQLGRRVLEGRRLQALVPREVEIRRKKVKSIHSGSFHSFAVTTDGLVYAWGLNSFTQCGIYMKPQDESTTTVVPIPTRVPALDDQDVVMLDGGNRHSTALTGNGDLLAWGCMDAHQVGIGADKLPADNVLFDEASGKARCLIFPTRITETKFKTISCGSNHTIAIGVEDGAAYSWGFGDQYQCGHGEPGEDVKEPTKIVNTATTGVHMVGAACGGGVTVLAGIPAV